MNIAPLEKRLITEHRGSVWHTSNLLMYVDNITFEENQPCGNCRISDTFIENPDYLLNYFNNGQDPRLEIYIKLPHKSIKLDNVKLIDEIPTIIRDNYFSFKYCTN